MRVLDRVLHETDTTQRDIVAISNVRAKGHETIMRIIDNIGPTRRYDR